MREKVCNGEISSEELVTRFLERVNELNPKVNAIVTLNDKVMAEAKEMDSLAKKGICKPLHGIPVTIKDNILTKGIRTTFGSVLFKDFVPDEDSIISERLKEAGALILGKTNMPEFGLVGITDNPLFGVTKNPWDLTRTPGGSSGGSAVSIALGFSPISIGNDGGGSIRIPSSFCGVFGFKPSPHVIPKYPPPNTFRGISVDGPITRYVSDAILTMRILSGPDLRDRRSLTVPKINFSEELDKNEVKRIRIAYSRNLGYGVVDSKVEKTVEDAVYRFRELGVETIDEINPELPNLYKALMTKITVEFATFIYDKLEEWKKVTYKPYLNFLLPYFEKLTYHDYVKVDNEVDKLWSKLSNVFQKYDYLITPTVSVVAFKIEEGIGPSEINGQKVGFGEWSPFSFPFNLTGQPASSIPVGLVNNLPVGMQIIGKPYDDFGVLKLSLYYERNFSWHKMRPQV